MIKSGYYKSIPSFNHALRFHVLMHAQRFDILVNFFSKLPGTSILLLLALLVY